MTKIKKTSNGIVHRKGIIIAALISILLVTGAAVYAFLQKDSTSTEYPGTTAEERAETEARKPQLIKDNEAKTTPDENSSDAPRSVTPVITSAGLEGGQVVVAAYVPGIFEDGGSCKLEATKDGMSVVASSEAFANVSTTNCAPFRLERSQFASSGNWSVRVSYQSATASGASTVQTMGL